MTMNLLQMSFYGAVLILVITALRAAAINRLPKKTFLILWGIAMARLLIPYELPSALSVYSLIGSDTPAAAAVEETEFNYESYSPVSPVISFEASKKIMPSEPSAPSAPSAPKTQIPSLSSENGGFSSVLFVIWISGSILLAAFFAVSYLLCYLEFKTSLPVENEFTMQWLTEHKIKRPLSIRQSDKITVPLTYGVFRPVILMPKQTDWENTKQLRYVLLHEYVHVCRFDALLKLICVFALCLHWFNPAVWLMYILFNRDIELACDERVVKRSGLSIKTEYALMLIGTEEKKAGLMPLCSGFGKNCAKERIVAVMKIKKISALAVVAAVILTAGVTMAFATSALDFREDTLNIADTDFSDNELNKMLELKFEDYEKMSVSEFQSKVWELTDTKEYRDLFERFSVNEALYEKRDEEDKAYFIYNILFPLTRDNWRENRFDRCTVSVYEGTSDSAMLEYTITLTIQNAYTLTVGEYDTARLNMISGISEFFWDQTPEQLRNEEFMREAIDLKFEELIQFLMNRFASDKLKISASFSYDPLVDLTSATYLNPLAEGSETRRYPNGSEEDYRSLLKLKTPDFQSVSLKDFNLSLLEWADEDPERTERIDEDARYNDFSVDLSADELSFITLSVYLSGRENAKHVQSVYTGDPEEDPSHSLQLPSKTAEKNGFAAWCDLYCEFSYHISDKETVTVGERDKCIGGMINGIREFWDNTDIEELLKMTRSDIVKRLNELAGKYGNGNIAVAVSEDRVGFERMDERETANRETAVSENIADPKIYDVYKPFGLTINQADSKLYYGGKLVRCFDDQIPTGFFSVKAIGYYEKNGVVDVRAVRESSRLTGLEVVSEEEFNGRIIKEDVSSHDTASGTSMFDLYLEYGLEYDKEHNALFYGDKRVRLFWDSLSSDSKPSASESPFISTVSNWDEKGTVDLYVVRDHKQKDRNGYGKITGLRIADQQEFENNTSIFADRGGEEEYGSFNTAVTASENHVGFERMDERDDADIVVKDTKDTDFDWDWDDNDDFDWDWDDKALMEAYAAYGIEKDGKTFYYKDEPVYIIMDPRPDSSFYLLEINPKGTVSIKVIRNTEGKITGVAYLTEEEAAKLLSERIDEEHEEIYSGEIVDSFPFFDVKPGQYALSEAVYEIKDTALFDYSVNWEPMGNYIRVGLISTDKSRVYSDSCISGRASGSIEIPSGSYYVMVYNEPSSDIDLNAAVAYNLIVLLSDYQ